MGETLTESTLNKSDSFRGLFEENGYRLTNKRNMFDLISGHVK